MDARKISVGIVSLVLLAGASALAFAQPAEQAPAKAAEKSGEESDEEVIAFAKAPEAVRAAALKLVGAGGEKAITKVIKEEDEEVYTYEIEYTEGGAECAAIFSAAGELMESEKATAEAKLPEAIMASLKKDYPKATFAKPFAVTKMYYEIEVVIDGKKHEVKVDAAGKIEDETKAASDDKEAAKDEQDEQHGGDHAAAVAVDDGFRATFGVGKHTLGVDGTNPYFSLKPGLIGVYHEGKSVLTVTALDETRVIDGVTTRVVTESEVKDGKPVEVSRNYFAIDKATGDVYYFGEDVDEYDAAGKVSHPGVWHSGVNGARFGLFLSAVPRLGDKYYQEVAPGVAMDRVEVVSLDEKIETPAGVFEHCVHLRETTPLDTDIGHKWFAPGVGLVKDGATSLFSRHNAAEKP